GQGCRRRVLVGNSSPGTGAVPAYAEYRASGDARIMTAPIATAESVSWGTPRARWILLATVLGSAITFLDATVVNVALPTIGTELDASVAGLQWVVNGYTLTLASLILLGGSLGDLFGRRKVFVLGVVWFAVASLLCSIAPTSPALVAA